MVGVRHCVLGTDKSGGPEQDKQQWHDADEHALSFTMCRDLSRKHDINHSSLHWINSVIACLSQIPRASGQRKRPAMFFFMDTQTQLFLFTSILLCSFFLASAMHGVLGRDGFGVIGNLIVITTGFYLGLWLGRYYGLSVRNFEIGVLAGLAGSFLSLLSLTVMKAFLSRF